MGSTASLAVVAQHGAPRASAELAQRAVRAWFDTVEQALSPYREDSDLCRWRRGERMRAESPLLDEVVADCEALARLTGGGFRPYDRAGRYDPTGYVKGWAIERGADLLVEHGVTDACLGIGGDLQMVGRPGSRPWRVGVVDPADWVRVVAVVEAPPGAVARFAVATSGNTQRGAHIWPATRFPERARPTAHRLASITVVGPDLRLADAFATAIWARALDEPLGSAWAWLPGTGYDALAVDPQGHLRVTPGMPGHLARAA
jgi:thiamine biosynthesis lipoprotein